MHKKLISFFLCLAPLLNVASMAMASIQKDSIGCLDLQGKTVAWWVVIKTPDTLNEYVYRDAQSPSCAKGKPGSCFGTLKNNLSDPEAGPLSHTLQQIYRSDAKNSPGYLMYNDDTPAEDKSDQHSEFAHAKGVLATGLGGGFWLVHSVPRFPKDQVLSDAYTGISSNGAKFAQSFLCVSLKISQLKAVGTQLHLTHPFIYQKGGFDERLLSQLGPDFRTLLSGEEDLPSSSAPHTGVKSISTTSGIQFLSVSKSKYWGKDLYDGLVANVLNSDLIVNSWSNGQGSLPTICANTSCRTIRFPNRRSVCVPSCADNPDDCKIHHDVANVTQIKLNDVTGWSNSKDHSKWAITVPSAREHAVCIGDINRQNGQRVRGGGTVCLTDDSLWKAFYDMIDEADVCPPK